VEVLKKVVNELPDCYVEAVVSKELSDNALFEKGVFKKADSGERVKLEVRVTKGSRSAYAWTNNLIKWRDCVLRANKLMLASSQLKAEPIISSAKSTSKSFINPVINKVDFTLLKEKGDIIVSSVKNEGVATTELKLSKSIITESFLNSNLTGYEQERSALLTMIECTLDNSSYWDFRTSQGLNIDFEEFGVSTAKTCKDSLKAKKLDTGLFNVVFNYQAINGLLEILLPSLSASNIIEHNSFLEGKEGQEIINPLITIKDAGTLPDGTNNSVSDGEGTPVNTKPLFNKGVLSNFINDLYTATRMNAQPTGNSAGLLKRGFIAPNNILIKPGDASDEELLDDCVFVNHVMGVHTANTISGDFALNALNAFKYENGIRKPVRDIMISGNIFELLKRAVFVGKKPRSEGSLSTPMIKFENVQLVG